MIDFLTPLGEQMRNLFNLFDVDYSYYEDTEGEKKHVEFITRGFDTDSEDQVRLLASICYHIQTGFWSSSINTLSQLQPDLDLDFELEQSIHEYFSGSSFGLLEERKEHFQNQRNPFILEVLANCMLFSVEKTPNFDFVLRAMNKIHLSSKIQGLDAAAIASTASSEYYIIVGEAKNRDIPSQGTSEAFEAFQKHDSGRTWADIRQLVGLISEAARLSNNNGVELTRTLSKWSVWKDRYIYRLTIEHKTKKPHGGSQFKDYHQYTQNVVEPERRQCESFGTKRLTEFYEKVSRLIVEYIESKGEKESA
ncbi:hypothetical protein RB620_18300 [Paenibacillus sp. LHD-117]|uniref:hypothetical protein n=1 Tax=Paenibacillus sp. LHD-117 TaxID=3071412 RepID=UPI0027E10535|nr:hypothetical protein [Paenibacillus sp. LHD-117]MDQ6421382.1 hypothetical protein [Paenibacillus sp. LHD-117]